MAKNPQDEDSVIGAKNAEPQSKQEYAAYYREYAGQIRELAEGEPDTVLRARLQAVAEHYERLADQLDPKR